MKLWHNVVLLSLLIVAVAAYLATSSSAITPSTPSAELSISTKSYDNKTTYSLRRSGDARAVKSVQIIKDEPTVLEVQIKYDYDDLNGTEVSTCGGAIKTEVDFRDEWSCMPSRIQLGEHTVIHRITLLDERAENYYCTDSIRVNMYQHGGSTFFNQLYKYRKAWLDGQGFYANVKQAIYGFTVCRL